jgi:hypothetical protein
LWDLLRAQDGRTASGHGSVQIQTLEGAGYDPDRRIEPPPATVIDDGFLAYEASGRLMKCVVGFKSAGKELGMSTADKAIRSTGDNAYENRAIALPSGAVPDDFIDGGHLLEARDLSVVQVYGRNLGGFDRGSDFDFMLGL